MESGRRVFFQPFGNYPPVPAIRPLATIGPTSDQEGRMIEMVRDNELPCTCIRFTRISQAWQVIASPGPVAGPRPRPPRSYQLIMGPQNGCVRQHSQRTDAFQNLATDILEVRCQSRLGAGSSRQRPRPHLRARQHQDEWSKARRQSRNFSTASLHLSAPPAMPRSAGARVFFRSACRPSDPTWARWPAATDKCLAFFGATHIPSTPTTSR